MRNGPGVIGYSDPDIRRQRLIQKAFAAQQELQRRKAAADGPRKNPLDYLFPRQREAADDPASVAAWLCGRRSGKTVGACAVLLSAAQRHPGSINPYITLTRKNAKLIAWPTIKMLARRLGWDASLNESELSVKLPNGAMVILGGCKDRSELEKWRGLPFGRAVIDEPGSFPPYLKELYSDVLRPGTVDFDGGILFVGTPGILWDGLWYEMTGPNSQMNIKQYHWTMFDNPHLPHAQRVAGEIKEENGWDDESPTWVREYLGQWVYDFSDLVFPFDVDANQAEELPNENFVYCIGIDVGMVDATSFVVTAHSERTPNDYILESEKHTGWLTAQVAHRVRQLLERYPSARVVLDTGGMGKVHAEELRRRFGIPVIAAEKRDKLSAVRVIRDRFRSGQVKLLSGERNDSLRDEISVLRWNGKYDDFEDGQEDHAAHGMLYALRELRGYLYNPRKPEPRPGSPEAGKAEERRIIEALQRKHRPRGDGRASWDR